MFNILRSPTQTRCLIRKLSRHNPTTSIATTRLSATRFKSSVPAQEVVSFPSSENEEDKPILLNSKEHAVGYLSKILNARVYDAAIETQLQHAHSLSEVRYYLLWFVTSFISIEGSLIYFICMYVYIVQYYYIAS